MSRARAAGASATLSIRTHILLIVLAGAVLPLALVGVWLTQSAVRSGEDLLQRQLEASVTSIASVVQSRWYYRRGDLLLISDNEVARRVLATGTITGADSQFLKRLADDVARTIPAFELKDASGIVRWSTSIDAPTRTAGLNGAQLRAPSQPIGPAFSVRFPVQSSNGGAATGTVDARVRLAGLLPPDSGRLGVPGASLGVREHGTQAVLMAVARRDSFPDAGPLSIDGAPWRAANKSIAEPALDFAVAAPAAAYVLPFQRSGRTGLLALALVTLLAFALSAYLTARLTRSLHRLVAATAAVSQGQLERRVEEAGPAEITALATAFNAMTDSLRRTLDELSRRSALAAVGEFAASLAHEVRNALTSVRVDLQRAERKLPVESPSRELVSRTLASVTRLNAAVTGALRVARSGTIEPRRVELLPVLLAAAEGAAPAFAASGSELEVEATVPTAESPCVSGDPDSLEQLFLNLMINAGQSLDAGGRAIVKTRIDDGQIVVSIEDNGAGMGPIQLDRIAEPFYTTRAGGTGLGLPIARQIAMAHGGDIAVESNLGKGTTVRVRLPGRAR